MKEAGGLEVDESLKGGGGREKQNNGRKAGLRIIPYNKNNMDPQS